MPSRFASAFHQLKGRALLIASSLFGWVQIDHFFDRVVPASLNQYNSLKVIICLSPKIIQRQCSIQLSQQCLWADLAIGVERASAGYGYMALPSLPEMVQQSLSFRRNSCDGGSEIYPQSTKKILGGNSLAVNCRSINGSLAINK